MDKKNKLIISASVWLLLILIQTLLLGAGANATMFWGDPRSYYSIWVVDLLLIGLYYANFYKLAPYIIHTKQYGTYVWFTMIFAVLTILLPVIFYYAFGWSLPGTIDGSVPIYLGGAVLALVMISVGLSIKAVKEWVRLEDKTQELQAEILRIKAESRMAADIYVEPLKHSSMNSATPSTPFITSPAATHNTSKPTFEHKTEANVSVNEDDEVEDADLPLRPLH